MQPIILENLPREKLVDLIRMYSKNWLTLDGLWFSNVEKKYGLGAAEQLDLRNWETQAVIEARRIKKIMGLENAGLSGILSTLSLMSWQLTSEPFVIECESSEKVILYWDKCAVQEGRRRNNKPVFACKKMKQTLLTGIAKVVESRAKVKCRFGPPDEPQIGHWCEWEIYLDHG